MYTSIHNFLVIVNSDIPKFTLGEYCPMRSQKKVISPLSLQVRIGKCWDLFTPMLGTENNLIHRAPVMSMGLILKTTGFQLFKSTSGE